MLIAELLIIMEIWKDIEGYEGLYQVSNIGRIKSMNRIVNNNGGTDYRKERVIKQDIDRGGYIQTHLSKDGKVKTLKVHRLVAKAFPEICGEWFDGCEIDHIDGVKNNNKATNLKVCTKSENMRNPLTTIKISNSKKKPVLQYTQNGEFIREWDSALTAANELSISRSTILISLKGGNTRKYKWVYKEDNLCA